MSLEKYRSKRQFSKTPEPPPSDRTVPGTNRFYVQRHSARRLHYDLRLEVDGVLKSWAVPKGPTLDPTDKRLAVEVEDHPIEYGEFQGTIPQGNYGAGTVLLWDCGDYELLGEATVQEQLKRGDLKFRLHGQKLAGEFALVRTKKVGGGGQKEWLLIKKKDFAVIAGWDPESDLRSVLPIRADPSTIPGAVPAQVPSFISPMLATLSTSLPEGPDWVYEPKWDGVRAFCVIQNQKVSLTARSGRPMDAQYPELADLARNVSADTAVIDGEIVALDENGRPSFSLLQQRITAGPGEAAKQAQVNPVGLFAFDLLYLEGYDLTQASLIDRKSLLKSVLKVTPLIRYSEHFHGNGYELLQAARDNQLEGVVAKRGSSRYESKRSSDWVKVKVVDQQDFVICGFTTGEREPFGALVLGYYKDKKLLSAGNVGTGFNQASLNRIYELLQPLVVPESPLSETSKIPGKTTWVTPKVVCTVKYMAWTKEGHLRAPVFVGIRNDVDPLEVVQESAAAAIPAEKVPREFFPDKRTEHSLRVGPHLMKFTNLNKIFYPREGYTKRDIIEYYNSVAPLILPYLKDRPLSLKRYPDGIEGEYFFQKNAALGTPAWLRSELIDSEHRGEPIRFLFAEDKASLLYFANLGCIDHNPWMSRYGTLDHPDFLLIDLDPVSCTFDRIVEAANLVRRFLDIFELQGCPKTTGGDGLHIYVPLAPEYSYEQVRSFAEILARLVAAERPDLFTTPRTVSQREKGKVYFDYLQISSGKTIAAPYVLRAFPGAPVATPLRWSELTRDLTPDKFNLPNALQRFSRVGDLFAPVLTNLQKLEGVLEKVEQHLKSRK